MAIIQMPAARIQTIEWRLDRPAQVNRSAYTGRRKVVTQPGHARWSASLTLAPIVGQANILAWRAFLAKLKGQINTFRVPAVEANQIAGFSDPTTQASAGAGATSITLAGSLPALPEGAMATIADQLVILTAPSSAGTITFEPPLRYAIAAGQPVSLQRPTCLVALTGSETGWSVAPGQLYGASLDVEEAF